MKIHLSSFGEGHDPDQLTALMKEIELLAMRAGYPFVFVSGETETLNLILGGDKTHTRDEWKRQWAAGKTNMPYIDWAKEDCASTCGSDEEDRAEAQWTAALMEMYSLYVNRVDPDDNSLMLFKEWKALLITELGYAGKPAQVAAQSDVRDIFRAILGAEISQHLPSDDKRLEMIARDDILERYRGYRDNAGDMSLSAFIDHQLPASASLREAAPQAPTDGLQAQELSDVEKEAGLRRHYGNYLNHTTDHPPLLFGDWAKGDQPSS